MVTIKYIYRLLYYTVRQIFLLNYEPLTMYIIIIK